MFGAFILCCGTTHAIHVLEVLNVPSTHIAQTIAKICTAIVSFCTLIALYDAVPLVLSLPSRSQLESEVFERKAAQKKLQDKFKAALLVKEVTEEIRKFIKVDEIAQITAVRLGQLLHASRCTVHLNLEGIL
jgi:hypothetical protein